MDKLSINLIKAGLLHLINTNKDAFVDNLAVYLSDKLNIVNYLIDGPLPINEEIKEKVEKYVKSQIPCIEDFVEILDVTIGFDYADQQQYCVTYKIYKYYSKDKLPYNGIPIKDEEHPLRILTTETLYIDSYNIKKHF